MPNTPKILIISSDTGGGHRSAAQALADGLEKFWKGESVAIRVIKAVEESHHITEKMVGVYNWVLRNKQHWMKYLYWAMNRFRPETRDFFHRRCIGFCTEIFEKWCPHIVISVHPLTQHIFARILKELNLAEQIPLVTVVTDPCYGFWKGWACNDVSLYLVANEDAERQLIDYGISPEKIKISGMPIHPKFHEVDESVAQEARRAFGLNPDKFTVFVNAGWVGGGNIPQIFKELVRGDLDVQAVFLAGKNEELKKQAEAIAKNAKFPVKVIGYSDEIEKIMQSANVMISKLGGLTTFEALACRLPIIADATTPPMPQEAGTVSLIEKKGAGILLQNSIDIVPTIQSLLSDSKKYAAMKAATVNMAIPNSTQRIIEEISALLPVRRETPKPQVVAA
ncbi:MAG: UDP-N-acetylglucosamine:LPS N-acetylglucosamine transferase [Acidobacteria bacterium]|nr:UDP-N-acetylglucosamine:LPS N-acetylglucosamine transferase [Acidobacteriota bacterium]